MNQMDTLGVAFNSHGDHNLLGHPVIVAGIALYSLLLFALLGAAWWSYRTLVYAEKQAATDTFFGCLIPFAFIRVVWLFTLFDIKWAFIGNRLCFNLFLTAFSAVALFWMEMYNNLAMLEAFPYRRMMYYAFNIVLWACQIAFVITELANGEPREDQHDDYNFIYDANIVFIMAITLALALMFLVYFSRIAMFYYNTSQSVSSARVRFDVLIKIVGTTTLFASCFAVRVAFFCYRPATHGGYLPEGWFWTFAYFVPEIVPTVWELYLQLVRRSRSHRSRAQSISDAFDEHTSLTDGASQPSNITRLRQPSDPAISRSYNAPATHYSDGVHYDAEQD